MNIGTSLIVYIWNNAKIEVKYCNFEAVMKSVRLYVTPIRATIVFEGQKSLSYMAVFGDIKILQEKHVKMSLILYPRRHKQY